MSDDSEQEYGTYDNDGGPRQKRRKASRACDMCRKKKIKCEGQVAGKKCTSCTNQGYTCTYQQPVQKRTASYPKSYVDGLEKRVRKMENIFRKLTGGEGELSMELLNILEADPSMLRTPHVSTDPAPNSTLGFTTMFARSFPHAPSEPLSGLGTEDESEDEMHEQLNRLHIRSQECQVMPEPPFIGKSTALALMYGSLSQRGGATEKEYDAILSRLRDRFWSKSSELDDPQPLRIDYTFPEPDLMHSLVELYFDNLNPYIPIFHRPTFERLLHEGTMQTDRNFAATLLCVCAVGARFSKDPRVCLQDVDNSESSAGWVWFRQVYREGQRPTKSVSVYELQKHALLGIYLQGTMTSELAWTVFGAGVRLGLDAGAHRKAKPLDTRTRPERELWKRAFWCLVWLDRFMSTGLGRSCAIQDEEIDVEYPAVCDDEYWHTDDPKDAFVQPQGKPSKMAYFILCLELSQMTAFCMRTLYSLNKTRALLSLDNQGWMQHLVTELDSAMNRWVDSIPEHLRWDPHRQDDVFFNQSVVTYSFYYHLQILVHRPFIIPSKRTSAEGPGAFASLAVCTNAARVTSHIMDCLLRRKSQVMNVLPTCALPVFCSALVLLLNVWSGKRSGMTLSAKNEMQDIQRCINALRSIEDRWMHAGRLCDILEGLTHAATLYMPSTPQNKRHRNSDSLKPPSAASSPPSSGVPSPASFEMHTASMSRVHRPSSSQSSSSSHGHPMPLTDFTLPTGHDLCDMEQMRMFTMNHYPGKPDYQAMFLEQMSAAGSQQSTSTMPPAQMNDQLPGPGLAMGPGYVPSWHPGSMDQTTPQQHWAQPGYTQQPQFSTGTAPDLMDDSAIFGLWPVGINVDDWSRYMPDNMPGPSNHS
ncbi:hypothetical protein CYLTODRAFT_279122 [Cylindrobasidium torrendii FP15055 ss-10]|uniref:Zn(2)-C6 fungal-type domain-containing protein n=1 Tax=Cylindrobasidium torrendii FP15055 ss-10 TaxID=1314674 RepID=A0A0D7BCB2_9AGAR|nr:hypothetical protein CYLTODRAFT_279122 [Cylindrobasidium torrendii FP15055 ss-10]